MWICIYYLKWIISESIYLLSNKKLQIIIIYRDI